jgi:CHAT domain-containing protein
LFGIGNPLPLPEGAKPLEFARPEVEEIAPLFKGRSTVLVEQQATHEQVKRHLNDATYLHLSCHGQFNADKPLESAVILSGGERLTLADLITRHRLTNVRLAVLSACQTAITDYRKLPEEAIGLPAGFLQAGVPGVVGSLWPVNDLSTALLMIRFYEYHLRGDARTGEGPMPPAFALRKAQLWLRDVTNAELSELFDMYRKATPNSQTQMAYDLAQERFREYTLRDPNERPFSHPYYWAAFAFYGV